MVYAESNGGGPFQCCAGQSSMTDHERRRAGSRSPTRERTQLTAPGACAVVPGANGTITIDVPLSQVSLDAGVAPVQLAALQRHGEHDDAPPARRDGAVGRRRWAACRST